MSYFLLLFQNISVECQNMELRILSLFFCSSPDISSKYYDVRNSWIMIDFYDVWRDPMDLIHKNIGFMIVKDNANSLLLVKHTSSLKS